MDFATHLSITRKKKSSHVNSNLPCDIKNGIRNLPETTILRRSCNVVPSNGKAPQTKTYKTTPKLHISARGPSYSRPKKTYTIPQGREWEKRGKLKLN